MKLKENEKIPNSEIFILENGEPTKKKIEELLKNKKAVIFGLPGSLYISLFSQTFARLCKYASTI